MENNKNIYTQGTRTELESALDSESIRITAYLRADAKAPLLVYVEDTIDIPFWTELFQCVKEKYSEINITTLKERAASGKAEINGNGNALIATGKDALLQVQGLGAHKVVAIDRDYDGLIDDYHTYTNEVRNNKYVIPTTYYSIENHIVSPMAINACLQHIIGTEHDYATEYQSVLEKFNKLLDPILLLLLVCIESHIHHGGRILYKMKNLSSDISDFNNKQDNATIDNCRQKISLHCGGLMATRKLDIERMKARLVAISKYPNALWKVVKGHTLYAFVYGYMLQIVKNVFDMKKSAIYTQYGHGDNAEEKIKKLQEQMFAPYGDLRACVYYTCYNRPTIDYLDIGILKIIDKIKNIH